MTYMSRRNRQAISHTVCAVGLAAFCLGALGMGLLVQMAVYVAQGGSLHIGADILFAGYTSAQLCVMAVTCGAAALVGAILALVSAAVTP